MKTNHQRNFVASDDTLDNRRVGYIAKDVDLDIIVTAGAGCHCLCCGGHGLAREKRGAKKFTHSRMRAKTKEVMRNIENLD